MHATQKCACCQWCVERCWLRCVEWTSGRPDRSKGILGDIILRCAGAIGGDALTLGARGNGGFHLHLLSARLQKEGDPQTPTPARYTGVKWTRASEGHTNTTHLRSKQLGPFRVGRLRRSHGPRGLNPCTTALAAGPRPCGCIRPQTQGAASLPRWHRRLSAGAGSPRPVSTGAPGSWYP